MTDTLAAALPREIARVTAKKERWQGYMRDHGANDYVIDRVLGFLARHQKETGV